MAHSGIILPSDTSNTGPKERAQTRTFPRAWTASMSLAVGDWIRPSAANGNLFKVTVSDGAAGTTEPTWSSAASVGQTVALDGVTYQNIGSDQVYDTYSIVTDETTGNAARVLNANPSTSDYGLLVRDVPPTRTQRAFHGLDAATATSETLFTLTPVTNFVTGSTGTSIAVPSGKTFVIQNIFAGFRQGTATAAYSRVIVRVNPSGAVTTTSPVIAGALIPTQLAAIGGGNMIQIPLVGGGEIPVGSGAQIGATHISLATGHFVTVIISGYEV
jgi:hypothetical protein